LSNGIKEGGKKRKKIESWKRAGENGFFSRRNFYMCRRLKRTFCTNSAGEGLQFDRMQERTIWAHIMPGSSHRLFWTCSIRVKKEHLKSNETVRLATKKDKERLLGSLVKAMTTTITWMAVPCENKKVIQENTFHARRDRCTV
jgi:hypothetical protein